MSNKTISTYPDDGSYWTMLDNERANRAYLARLAKEECHHGVSLTADCRPCGVEAGEF